MQPLVTFEEIWAKEFAPLVAERRATITARRSEAFLDVPLTVCGEEVRQMTPADLLMLDGFASPFVCASRDEIVFEDVLGFLWQLHVDNRPSWLVSYRLGRLERRLRRRTLPECVDEVHAYCHRMFADFPEPADAAPEAAALRREPATHFLGPLLVSVSREIGPIDPMSGKLLSEIPLPRLVQYRLAAQPPEDEPDDLAGLRNRCMDRVNHLNAAARGVSIARPGA